VLHDVFLFECLVCALLPQSASMLLSNYVT
jgi:hypothetical protein